jgi:DNA topoisomerase-2
MSVEKKYRKLDDISHILSRSGMYVGSIKPNTSKKWILDSGRFIQKDVTFNPAFIKIFDEILINSVDESKRVGSKLDTIKVNIENNTIKVWDNGGIDVVIHKEYNQWIPEMIFSSLKAGSNFDDEEIRTTAGLNGVGSVLTNVFSKKFTITTCDGKNIFTQTFSNNMREKSEPKIKKNKINHTEISYLPDYEKFGLSGMNEDHFLLIKKKVIDIAGCNPDIKVFFNDEEIKIKSFEDYVKYYKSEYFFETNKEKTWSISASLSEEGFQQVSFVNSTDTYDGGTHVDYILNQIISKMREYFKKKYKYDIKPSELKNHLFLFVNCTVVNPSFSSQTKEKLITEPKDFGYQFEVSDKLINQILKSEIVNSILDWIQQKKSADESKLTRQINKQLSNIKVEKLIDAKGKDRLKCSLGIFEGDSSVSAFRKYRTPEIMGAFALKGKFINVNGINNSKLVQNKELVNLMGAIGLKLGSQSLKDIRYGKILLFVDADVDGNSIAGLLLNFFHTYWPDMFDRKMIFKVETPIVVAIEKRNKNNKKIFYTQTDYNNWESKINPNNWEIKYKKGLASLVDDEYKEIINNPKLTNIHKDDLSDTSLNIWFGKDSDLRKKELI